MTPDEVGVLAVFLTSGLGVGVVMRGIGALLEHLRRR